MIKSVLLFWLFFISLPVYSQHAADQPCKILTDSGNEYLVSGTVSTGKDSINFSDQQNNRIFLNRSEIKLIKIEIGNEWKTIYSVGYSDPSDSLTQFNMSHLLLQTLSGYAFGIVFGVSAGTLIYHSTYDQSGFLSVIGGLVTFICISPLVVQMTGEFLDDSQSTESDFTGTLVGSGIATVVSSGGLTPIGAALGYQFSKRHASVFIDDKNAPDWVKEWVRK